MRKAEGTGHRAQGTGRRAQGMGIYIEILKLLLIKFRPVEESY